MKEIWPMESVFCSDCCLKENSFFFDVDYLKYSINLCLGGTGAESGKLSAWGD